MRAARPPSDDELAAMTRTAQGIAGLAALGFNKREAIATRVADELEALLPDDEAWLADAPAADDEAAAAAADARFDEQAAVACAGSSTRTSANAARDVRAERHRAIATRNAAFAGKIAPLAPGVRILRSLGFEEEARGGGDGAAAAEPADAEGRRRRGRRGPQGGDDAPRARAHQPGAVPRRAGRALRVARQDALPPPAAPAQGRARPAPAPPPSRPAGRGAGRAQAAREGAAHVAVKMLDGSTARLELRATDAFGEVVAPCASGSASARAARACASSRASPRARSTRPTTRRWARRSRSSGSCPTAPS